MKDSRKVRDRRILDSARQAIAKSRDVLNTEVPRIVRARVATSKEYDLPTQVYVRAR